MSADKRVTGIGGIFFQCVDPAAMRRWYETHLGIAMESWGANFEWRQADDPTKKGFTAWGPFNQNARKFEPTNKPFMVNYRVQNLERLLEQLKSGGVTVLPGIESLPYGKFAHILDPEGNKIELWEPVDAEYEKIVEKRTT